MGVCVNCKHAKEMKQGKKIMYWCSVFKGIFNSNKSNCEKHEEKK